MAQDTELARWISLLTRVRWVATAKLPSRWCWTSLSSWKSRSWMSTTSTTTSTTSSRDKKWKTSSSNYWCRETQTQWLWCQGANSCQCQLKLTRQTQSSWARFKRTVPWSSSHLVKLRTSLSSCRWKKYPPPVHRSVLILSLRWTQ